MKKPLTAEKEGSEVIPRSKHAETAENADMKTQKMQEMRLTGFKRGKMRTRKRGKFGKCG